MEYTVEEYFSLTEEERRKALKDIEEKEKPLTEDEEEILDVEHGYLDELPYYNGLYEYEGLLEEADEGDLDAKWKLVQFIAMGKAEDYADKSELDKLYYSNLCTLAEANKVPAYIMLGGAILKGTGCEQNSEDAIRWYEKAVANGERFGNECIGEIYFAGKYVSQDYKKAYEYFTKDDGKKSYCTLYHLGEMYRMGLYVEKDLDKASEYYQKIVFDDNSPCKIDDYYWRACYRYGMTLFYEWESEAELNAAFRLITEAKDIYEKSESEEFACDITKDELYRNWQTVEQEVQ